MLENIPISGYALCYGPLAVIIIGFIVFAAMTDGKARRTYLRLLDPRSDEERLAGAAATKVVDKPVKARTPTGMMVTIKPQETAVAPEAAAPEAVAAVAPDNLQKIEGIGPKMNEILQNAGINTFSQLADTSVSTLRRILDDAGMSRINDPETWPEQARLAAQGNWDALATLQDELKGGRRA